MDVYKIVDTLGPKSDLFKAIGNELTRLKTENETLANDNMLLGQQAVELELRLMALEGGAV